MKNSTNVTETTKNFNTGTKVSKNLIIEMLGTKQARQAIEDRRKFGWTILWLGGQLPKLGKYEIFAKKYDALTKRSSAIKTFTDESKAYEKMEMLNNDDTLTGTRFTFIIVCK